MELGTREENGCILWRRSSADYPVLPFSRDVFHRAHELKADHVHVDGSDFAFDLEKVDNHDYNPVYFSDRWKGQYAFFPYENYDETALNTLYLPYLQRFSRIFISEANEYSVVLTAELILKYTDADLYFTDRGSNGFARNTKSFMLWTHFPKRMTIRSSSTASNRI